MPRDDPRFVSSQHAGGGSRGHRSAQSRPSSGNYLATSPEQQQQSLMGFQALQQHQQQPAFQRQIYSQQSFQQASNQNPYQQPAYQQYANYQQQALSQQPSGSGPAPQTRPRAGPSRVLNPGTLYCLDSCCVLNLDRLQKAQGQVFQAGKGWYPMPRHVIGVSDVRRSSRSSGPKAPMKKLRAFARVHRGQKTPTMSGCIRSLGGSLLFIQKKLIAWLFQLRPTTSRELQSRGRESLRMASSTPEGPCLNLREMSFRHIREKLQCSKARFV